MALSTHETPLIGNVEANWYILVGRGFPLRLVGAIQMVYAGLDLGNGRLSQELSVNQDVR